MVGPGATARVSGASWILGVVGVATRRETTRPEMTGALPAPTQAHTSRRTERGSCIDSIGLFSLTRPG